MTTGGRYDATQTPTLGALLKHGRHARGLTQEELAERAEMSVRQLAYLEQDRKTPRPGTIRRLADALDLSPDDRTALLAAAAGHGDGQAQASVSPEPTLMLPEPPSSFVGRERELEALEALLLRPAVRLLTLTGPGGVGKTRLAFAAARRVGTRFHEGVRVVPLTTVSTPELVPSAVARGLDLTEDRGQSPEDQVVAYLRGRDLLLVLDNFEHVMDAWPFIARILTGTTVRILVTSREMLHLQGEYRYPVLPMTLPGTREKLSPDSLRRFDALALFLERAEAVDPGFAVTDRSAATIAAICAQLDGLPLAIELAAALAHVLSPSSLLDRLSERFALLTHGPRDAPERQRTLRATLEWSYGLLREGERQLFARLSVFSGGCALEAAEAVCAAGERSAGGVLSELAALVEKSLVRKVEGAGGDARYAMLPTIRDYGAELLTELGEAEETQDRHADLYRLMARRAADELRGIEQVSWLDRLEVEHDNLRSALSRFLERDDVETAYGMAVSLFGLWQTHCHFAEAERWFDLLLARKSEVGARARAELLGGAHWFTRDYRLGEARLAEGLALFQELGDTRNTAIVLTRMAGQVEHRDPVRAALLAAEALSFAREGADRRTMAGALEMLGRCEMAHHQLDRARAYFEEGLGHWHALSDPGQEAWLMYWLCLVLLYQGEYDRAAELGEEALARKRAMGDTFAAAIIAKALGLVLMERGDLERAELLTREALTAMERPASSWGPSFVTSALFGRAAMAARRGEHIRAARLWGAGHALRQRFGGDDRISTLPYWKRQLKTIRARMNEAAWTAAWSEGSAMTDEQAVAYALRKSDDDAGELRG